LATLFFNDTTLGHRFLELDGRSTIGARGAAIAATKGMIICNSAGNSGDEPWRHVGVPADASGIIAVGASNYENKRASFSSIGPTADGRIKPDLMAPGEMVVTAGNTGIELGLSNGTSLASPMLSGAIASLWSAFPEKSDREILDAVFDAADQKTMPNLERGYGLPDFTLAWLTLGGFYRDAPNKAGEGTLFAFDRETGTLSFLHLDDFPGGGIKVGLYNLSGQLVLQPTHINIQERPVSRIDLHGMHKIQPGAYRVAVSTPAKLYNWIVFL